MITMLLCAAAPYVFVEVFWRWCVDEYGMGKTMFITIAIALLKIHDILPVSKAYKAAKEFS